MSRSTMRSFLFWASLRQAVAQVAAAGLVDEGDGVRREDFAVGAGALHAMSKVLGGVGCARLAEGDASVDARAE